MRPKKDIAKDQMDMAPYRKGGHTRRYAEGGDIENDEDVPARKVERIGKSALEEGEEEFQRMIAQRGRRAAPASKPASRRAPSAQMPTRMSASGVPVGEDEMAPRAGARSMARPTARQPSTAERMIEALPAGAAGIGAGALLARAAERARRATQATAAARRSRADQYKAFVGEPSTYGYARGGSVSSASSRADGIAQKGKTKGKVI